MGSKANEQKSTSDAGELERSGDEKEYHHRLERVQDERTEGKK